MKRLMLITIAMLMVSVFAAAQEYEPTTTWPYVYSEFIEGELQMTVGNPKKAKYNIHLGTGSLHFIDGELIKQASPMEVFSVKIGTDMYVNAGGRMMKVLAKSDKGVVALESTVDIATLNATGGAYGSSSNTLSTQALSSLEGIGGTRTNMNHMELRNSKRSGEILPLINKMYLVTEGYVVFATKKDVSQLPFLEKDALKAFFKANPIKWKDPQSLLLVVDYIADNN